MKINPIVKTSFKGYDALSLKALHLSSHWGKIKDELKDISKKEGFDVKESVYNGSFNQDQKVILEKDGKIEMLMCENVSIFAPHLSKIEEEYKMPTTLYPWLEKDSPFISGGNFFIGKNKQGEKWMIVGENEILLPNAKEKISDLYGIKEENIFFIPQQDYHLDMSIRPIGFPYVLVNNPALALKKEYKAQGVKPKDAPKFPKDDPCIKRYERTVNELKKCGFIPVEIGGVFGWGVNFMNAIVNKHPDGTISYITNSSKTKNPLDAKLQRIFEKELRAKLKEINKTDSSSPVLRDVYFVEGELFDDYNEMMDNILEGAGGIHCMTLEEPDFNMWA